MASINDKITDVRNAARPTSARATGTRSAGGTSLACDDLTGWPTASKVHFVTYQIDSNSNPVAGTQLDCRGIVSGNTIGSFLVLDGNDTGNSIGDVVEMLPTASWAQDLADALLAEHNRTGGHQGMTTDTIVVTTGTSLPAGDIGTADLAADAVTAAKLDDASVFPANLTTGLSGSTWAWQDWTPVWTNLTIGNGTNDAQYIQIGKTVHFRIKTVFGTTTTQTNDPRFTLPVAAHAKYTSFVNPYGVSNYTHAGAYYSGTVGSPGNSNEAQPFVFLTSATYGSMSGYTATVPVAFGTGDTIWCHGTYEVA